MASTGLLASTSHSPDGCSRNHAVYHSKVRRNIVYSSLVCSCSASTSEQATVQKFSYSRAIPSVRWPDLKRPQFETPQTQFPPFHLIPPPSGESEDGETEISTQTQEVEDAGPSLDSAGLVSQSRTRRKKMTKLALKRAKDWRQRVLFLTDKILNLKPEEFVADVLDERMVQMTPTDYCFVVKWVGQANWARALEVYEWLNLRHWYSPNARMLATILSVLGKANQEALAEEIFQRAESGIGDVVQVYNSMMGVFARNGKFSRVQELLSLMRARGCEPDLISFNTLINARAKAGSLSPGSALALLAEVRGSGLRPDTITYNTLISSCSRVSNFEEAVQVYVDMDASGCQPDLWTYNAMISVYGRCDMASEAERLFKELGRRGFLPDAVTYNSLLYAFAKEGNVEKVENVCQEMVDAGFRKDEMTYNTIIHMYGKQGRHDLAIELYKDMMAVGCTPDSVTYTVLIDSLGKADQITEAAKIMSEMVDAQVRPTLRTFSALICGYAKAGMRVEAEETYDCMVRSGIKPDQLAYSVMLDILIRSNEMRKTMSLYQEMIHCGFKPDQGLYQAMIQVFTKENKHEDVAKLVRDMEKVCGMNPRAILPLLVKAESYDRAADMLKSVITQGYEPEREDLLSILNSYSSSGRHSEARNLLTFLKKHRPESSVLVAEALIVMLCEDRQLEAAMEEYMKVKGFGLDKTSHVYVALVKCCAETESLNEASQVLSDMKFYAAEPSVDVYQCAVITYCKLGFPETGQQWLDQAERNGIVFGDQFLYVSLIEAYGKLKLLQRAEALVGGLRLHSQVDRKVWNALIDAYATSGQYEQARAVFNTMVKNGPFPTVDSINGLLQALIVDKRLDELYVVVDDLQDMSFKISKSTILLMLDAFARAGNVFEVKKIYNGMKAAGYLPTMHLYRSIIGLCARESRVRDVELMVAEMVEAGFKPDLVIFNSLLQMYTSIEDFKKAAGVYSSIKQGGFKPDVDIYNTLILMYCRDLRPEEGFSMLCEMQNEGLEPKLDTYKSLMAACSKQKLVEQAENLFQELSSKGYKLDRSVYHMMMKMYRDCGYHAKAQNLLVLMKETGVQPTVATMHILMVSYGTAGQPLEAESLLNNLKTSGLVVNTITYSSVIDAYLKNNDYKSGIQKLLEMRKDGIEPDCRIWTCFIRAASLCPQTNEALLLLNALRDIGFDLPIRLLTEKTNSMVLEVDHLLKQLESFEDNSAFNFVNALEDLLWAFQQRATASWVFQLAVRRGIYRHDLFRVAEKDWGADFRKLSAGAALVALTLWLDYMQDASLQGSPESPKSVVLITGTAEYHMVSLNSTLKAFLWEMGSPFLPCKTRTGLLVAKAHSLRMWLKDSPFCMDLELRDASSLPESNSMRLHDGCFMRAGLVPVFKDIHERLGLVMPKKFARLALLSEEKRGKVITADIEGKKQKLEKMKERKEIGRPRKKVMFGRRKFVISARLNMKNARRRHVSR
ncbi:pentatricopeptide repeat-containing protein At3g18110, chloroplastic [Aristolochia californica]|uniref:pentatricopeptide repeat-containing protein At3g18110, chloroplastic n=1 Tax=Aristolochia californica TaxID=171875 RepID=UPI0035E3BAA6